MIPLDKQSNIRPVNSVEKTEVLKRLCMGHTSTLEPTAVAREPDLEPLMDTARGILLT